MRLGEKVCPGCSHGHDCRVITCAGCGRDWHLLGLIADPFVCPPCDFPPEPPC